MHKFHARPAVAKTLGTHLLFVNVDLTDNSGAEDLYLKYAPEDAGVLMWVILSGEGKVLADAMEDVNGEKKNVGFPYEPDEVAHYEKALASGRAKAEPPDEVKGRVMKELKASAPGERLRENPKRELRPRLAFLFEYLSFGSWGFSPKRVIVAHGTRHVRRPIRTSFRANLRHNNDAPEPLRKRSTRAVEDGAHLVGQS